MAATAPPAELVTRFRPQMLKLGSFWKTLKAEGHRPRLTSWWRSIGHNREVGGQSSSQHLSGTAIDFTGVTLATVQPIAARFGLTAIASNRGAVHVQALPAGTVARLLRSEPALFS